MANRIFRNGITAAPDQAADSTEVGSRLRVPAERAVRHCNVFVNGERVHGPFTYRTGLEHIRSGGTPDDSTSPESGPGGASFVWLELDSPDPHQMAEIGRVFGIHELTIEDAVTAHQRPKLERYDDQLFMVTHTVIYRQHRSIADVSEVIETGEVQMLLGADFIITITHGMDRHDVELHARAEQIRLGPAGVAWAVTDMVVDEYVNIGNQLGLDVDEMESTVFSPRSRIDIEQIYMLKREILEMRHAVDPLAPVLRGLVSLNKDLVPKPVRSYLRDALDHQIVVADQIAGYDERLTSLINAAAAKISMQQNQDMRTISAYAALLAVPTALAGIYGMNFDNMPELHWKYGYFIIIALMVVIVGALLWFFKHNKWL